MEKSWRIGVIIGTLAVVVLLFAGGAVYFDSLSSAPVDNAIAESVDAPQVTAAPKAAPVQTAAVTQAPTAEKLTAGTAAPATASPLPNLQLEGAVAPIHTATPVPTATPTPTPTPTLIPTTAPTPTPRPNVLLPAIMTIFVPSGETEVRADLHNPEENENLYYLSYQLTLAETEEVLFTTGLIPAGSYCNKVTLSRPLEPGKYEAVLTVQPYRVEDWSPTSNADMHITLLVEE